MSLGHTTGLHYRVTHYIYGYNFGYIWLQTNFRTSQRSSEYYGKKLSEIDYSYFRSEVSNEQTIV